MSAEAARRVTATSCRQEGALHVSRRPQPNPIGCHAGSSEPRIQRCRSTIARASDDGNVWPHRAHRTIHSRGRPRIFSSLLPAGANDVPDAVAQPRWALVKLDVQSNDRPFLTTSPTNLYMASIAKGSISATSAPSETAGGHAPMLTLMNASKSALIWSLLTVHIPCGRPG